MGHRGDASGGDATIKACTFICNALYGGNLGLATVDAHVIWARGVQGYQQDIRAQVWIATGADQRHGKQGQ